MAGTIKLDGTTFLTKDNSNNFTLDVGSGGSISQGTIGDNVTFPAGSVLKVHSTSTTTALNNFSGNTYVDAISLTISNPVSSSSKFLIQNTAGGLVNNCQYIVVRVTRTVGATTDIIGSHISYHYLNQAWNGVVYFPISVQDEPSTASAITYKVQFLATTNTSQVFWNYQGDGSSNNISFLNVIEYQG